MAFKPKSYPLYSDEYFMNKALQQALVALEEGEVPIGAVVVAGGKEIIGAGHNQTERLNDVTAHAEIIAISAACNHLGAKYLKDCVIYVTIEPCAMCAAALGWAQTEKVVYGANDPKKGYTLFSPLLLHQKTQVSKGVLIDECSSLVTEFFKQKRKR